MAVASATRRQERPAPGACPACQDGPAGGGWGLRPEASVPAARLDAIRAWLAKSGLAVTGVSDHVTDGYMAVRGPVAAASRAFGVRFADFRLPGQGVVRAPQQAASIPAAVAGSVLAIAGLSTARQTMQPAAGQPAAGQPAAGQARAVRPLAAV